MTPSCHHADLSGTVGPKWFRGCRYQILRIQFEYIGISTPEYTNHKKNANVYCVVHSTLYTMYAQQYAETLIVCPRYARLHYEKGKLESISKVSGQICVFHCLRCVRCASYVRARLISLGPFFFYMRGIFLCSFAQIDETISTSSSSRPNHAIKMMHIFRR